MKNLYYQDGKYLHFSEMAMQKIGEIRSSSTIYPVDYTVYVSLLGLYSLRGWAERQQREGDSYKVHLDLVQCIEIPTFEEISKEFGIPLHVLEDIDESNLNFFDTDEYRELQTSIRMIDYSGHNGFTNAFIRFSIFLDVMRGDLLQEMALESILSQIKDVVTEISTNMAVENDNPIDIVDGNSVRKTSSTSLQGSLPDEKEFMTPTFGILSDYRKCLQSESGKTVCRFLLFIALLDHLFTMLGKVIPLSGSGK